MSSSLQIATKALESDAATLDLVLTMLGHLYKHVSQIADSRVREIMMSSLEDRWQSYDQRIYILAYILNPARHLQHLNSTCEFVSLTNVACLMEDVYEELFGEASTTLISSSAICRLTGGPSRKLSECCSTASLCYLEISALF